MATRWIKRTLEVTPDFHQVDLMGVVHNVAYFYWFERARLALLSEILPFEDSQVLGLATPVVENHCEYQGFARMGDALTVHTRHRMRPAPETRLTFEHEIVHSGKRRSIASGHTTIALMDWNGQSLVRNWPDSLLQRYQALR